MIRLHAMLMPGKTCCGVRGRVRMTGPRQYIVTPADLVLRIAKHRRSVTCLRCLKAIARHGEPLPWDTKLKPSKVKYLKGHRSKRPAP
jgi:hypothetical protein